MSERTSLADDDQPQRLQRLGAAMEALLRFQAGGAGADREQFLRDHADLRDVLEPLLTPDDDAAAPVADAAPTGLVPGTVLADYRIGREIGRGGMGTVYEAEQLSLHRRVALKVLHGHLAWSPRSIERFRREAAAASRLRHPGLVPIHDVGEWRGLHWFSMEFVDGTPLNERMTAPRLGVRNDVSRAAEAAELIARVAEALQEAHGHGLVHRDVKPHNVMVCADGSVRLLDFGLVADTDGPKDHSVTGAFLGTPHYCSPEQVAGQRVGPAADVFALGIVLYELLAAQRPFDAENTNAVLRRIEAGQYRRLRQQAPAVPRDLETICHKALEPAPRDRYANAGEFAADLRRFLRIEPIHAAPPSAWTRSTKWVRRHRLRVGLLVTSALLAAGVPTAWWLHLRDSHEMSRREGMLDQAEELGFRSMEQTLTLLSDQIDRQPSPGARHEPRADELARLCESFLAVRTDDASRANRIANMFWQLAGIYVHLGRAEPALAACARSRAVLLAKATPSPGDDVRRQLARLALREMTARNLFDPVTGEAEFALARAQWRPLVERTPVAIDDVVEFGHALLLRARNLADRPDQREAAEQLVREAQALATAERQRADARLRLVAVRLDGLMGQLLLDRMRTKEALPLLESVLTRIAAFPAEPVLVVEKALAEYGVGKAQMRMGQIAAAERSLRAAIATAEAGLQDWPGSKMLQRRVLASRVLCASQLMVQDKVDDAEELLRAAGATLAPLPADPSTVPWVERSLRADYDAQLANCLLLQPGIAPTDLEYARELLHEATSLLTGLVAEQPSSIDHCIDLGAAWNGLAALANEHGDSAAAIPFARRAIAAQQEALARLPEHRRARQLLGIHEAQLAWALAHTDAPDEAVAAAGRAIAAPVPPGALRLAAEAAARAAAQFAKQADGTADGRDRSEAAAALAVQALAKIAKGNQKEARRLLADPRFAALQNRDDAQRLRREVDG